MARQLPPERPFLDSNTALTLLATATDHPNEAHGKPVVASAQHSGVLFLLEVE